MTNQQGVPEALTDYEHRHAIRQGHKIAASDSYFEARPQIDTNDHRKVFEAGFDRGWDRHAALVDAQQPAPSAVGAVEWIGVSSHHLLQRDGILGKAGDVVTAQWPVLPQPSPTPQADSQPAPVLDSLLNIVINHEALATPAEVRSMAAELATYRAARVPASSQQAPALDRDRIREIFMAHGFTVKEGQTDLKQYVYDAADALLRAASTPADSVTAPAGGATAEPRWKSEDFEVMHYPPMPTTGMRVGMPKGVKVTHRPTGLFAVSEDERSQHMNREVAWNKLQDMLAAAPTPPAQAADSVLEDAARLAKITQAIRDYHFALDNREHGGVAMARAWNAICDVLNMDWVQGAESAARKQGGAT